MSMDYCLMYRVIAIHANSKWQEFFLKPLTIIGVNAIALTLGAGLAIAAFNVFAKPAVIY